MRNDRRDEEILLRALWRIGCAYSLSASDLSKITGIDACDFEEIQDDKRGMTLTADQQYTAKKMLVLFDELSAVFNQDDGSISRWLRTRNIDLDMQPIERLKRRGGIEAVCDYLTAYRSRS